MGQKVNPIGFRTGIMIGWKSRWYASKKEFASLLLEDKKTPLAVGLVSTEVSKSPHECHRGPFANVMSNISTAWSEAAIIPVDCTRGP